MRYAACIALVAALYILGGVKGERLSEKAAAACALASLLMTLADDLEIGGRSIAASLREQIYDERYVVLSFVREALEFCSNGEPLDRSLKKALSENSGCLSEQAAGTAMRLFDGIGRGDMRKETDALRAASQKLFDAGEEEAMAAAKLKGYYRTVYAIAGAALAVFFM